MTTGYSSSVNNTTGATTYTVQDQQGNVCTIVANPATGSAASSIVSFNMTTGTGLLPDGQQLLSNLVLMLQTGLRPNVIPGTNSLSN